MKHRIFTGSFAALEGRFVEEIEELQKDDPLAPAAILLGSNVLASYLKYRIAGRGRAVANLRFYTFLDLVNRLASSSQRETKKPRLPRLGAGIILDEILKAGGPKVFEKVSAFDGFRGAMLDTFRDLRDAGVTPDEFVRSINEIVGRKPDRREHLEGVANLFREFRQWAALFRDVDDDFRDAVGNSARAAEVLGCRSLLIYGIYDVTGQQAGLLRGLKDALNLFYFVPYANAQSSVFARAFIDECRRECGAQVEALPAPSSGPALEIFSEPAAGDASSGHQNPREQEPPGNFSLILVPGESRAAIEIVREILRAARDGIIAGFHEAAILLRHPEDEVLILAEAFRLRKLPFFVHGGMPFSQRPLSRAVIRIARLEADSFSRQSILRSMELIAAALPQDSAGMWDTTRWRKLTKDAGFLSGVESWDTGTEGTVTRKMLELREAENLARLPADLAEEELEGRGHSLAGARRDLEAAQHLRNGWLALRQASADWPEALSWRDWAHLLEQRLEPILGSSQDWKVFSAVLDEVSALNEVAETADPEHRIPRDRFTSVLEESLASFKYPEGRFQRNGVNILSITASRGLRFPLAIVPGLDEGRFPARPRQDPLLLDEERRWIGKPSRLPEKSFRAEEEKLLFDMATRSAEKRLVLIASRLDESSDRERIPSDFFLRAAAAARGQIVRYDELKEDIVPGLRTVRLDSPALQKGEVPIDDTEIFLRLIVSHPQSAKVLEALAHADPDRLARPKEFSMARWKRILTEYDGRLRDPGLVRWVAGKFGAAAGPVSASRLEEYCKCPYFFFLKRVMGLERWEEAEVAEGMDPLERGRVAHKILESFLKQYRGEKFLQTSPSELSKSLSALALGHLDTSRPPGIADLLWEIERERLIEMLKKWLEHETERLDDGLLPAYVEHPFGEFSPDEKSAAFRVQAGKHVFEFRGRIDRVDLARDGTRARVIDYKVGTLPVSMARGSRTPLMGGEKLQLAVYSGALSVLPEFAAVESVQAEYSYLQPKDCETTTCAFDPEALRQAKERLTAILEIIGNGIETGAFFARTSGSVRPEGHCSYCEYLTICGKDRIQREERKSSDLAVQQFGQMSILDGKSMEEE